MSLLGAAWTVGCLKAIAESRAASVTLFQTTGLRGLMEREGGSDAPDHFHSTPGALFPVYHVLAALAGWQGAQVESLTSSHREIVDAFAIRKEGRRRIIAANYTPQPRQVAAGSPGTLTMLDESTGPDATATSGTFTLPPFAVAVLDVR